MNLNEMIGFCGLDCSACPIHLAAFEKNEDKKQLVRIDMARAILEHYGLNVSPADITDCDGCRSESGRIFSRCSTCEIRKCATGKNLESCAFCSEYACTKLSKFFAADEGARTRLELIRRSR